MFTGLIEATGEVAAVTPSPAGWRLQVDGLVRRPGSFSLAELKGMAARTQITRHDCVEGWSAIGKWTGVPLSAVLNKVGLKPAAGGMAIEPSAC